MEIESCFLVPFHLALYWKDNKNEPLAKQAK